MAVIENLDNHAGELVNFIQAAQTVLGQSPAAQSAIASLTDSTGGTADGTLADVTATPDQTIINNNFADLAAKVNAILAALRSIGLIAT